MKIISQFGLIAILVVVISGCSETPEPLPEQEVDAVLGIVDEPIDAAGTQSLQESLMNITGEFATTQNQAIDNTFGVELIEQTDVERQVLIDTTLERSAERIAEQADKLSESLEQIKEIEHAPLPDA